MYQKNQDLAREVLEHMEAIPFLRASSEDVKPLGTGKTLELEEQWGMHCFAGIEFFGAYILRVEIVRGVSKGYAVVFPGERPTVGVYGDAENQDYKNSLAKAIGQAVLGLLERM